MGVTTWTDEVGLGLLFLQRCYPLDMPIRSKYFEDFKGDPTVLLWGDAPDLRELSAALRNIGANVSIPISIATDGKTVILKSGSSLGITSTDMGFEWELSEGDAGAFADKIEALLDAPTGHQYLDVLQQNAIAVIVSKGEYPEAI